VETLSESDYKILLACIEPRSKQEVSNKTGIAYPYCSKRMTKLRSRGYLESEEINRIPKYLTVRRRETEDLWKVRIAPSAPNVTEIMFYGQLNTFQVALNRVREKRDALNGNSRLLEVMADALAVIKVRSYRLNQGMTSQRPTSEEMKEILESYVDEVTWELELAKELLKREYLWVDSDNLWKFISEGIPNPKVLDRYKAANNKYFPSPKANNPTPIETDREKRLADLQKQWAEEG